MFTTPKMIRLGYEIDEVVAKYQLLQKDIALLEQEILLLQEREQNLYRSIFSQDTIDFGVATHYTSTDLNYGRYNQLILESEKRLYSLREQLYKRSVSLDDIELLAANKNAMTDCVPAIWPLDRNLLTNKIGKFSLNRLHPVLGYRRPHEGIDLTCPRGTPVVATGNGKVTLIEKKRTGYGWQVLVDHGFGYKTRYAHLSKIDVEVGQTLIRGEKVGEVGRTGIASGNHLHYEVILRGSPVDPMGYFSMNMTSEEFLEVLAQSADISYELSDEELAKELADGTKE